MAVSLLVPTDFFQPAGHALTYADNLASANGAELVPQHVGPTADTAAATDAITHTGRTIGLPPLKTLSHAHSAPAESILQVAATGNFDLVVLIARPRSFLGGIFHRSVMAQVLLHSVIPVLVLPTN